MGRPTRPLRPAATWVLWAGLLPGLGFALVPGLVPAAAAAPVTLLVHLPSEPIESAVKLGEAVTALGRHLSASLPGVEVQVQVFRRRADAEAYLAAHPTEVGMILADAAFLLDLPPGSGFAATHRFVRGGKDTFRRLLVVAAARSELAALSDLKQRSLTVVEEAGAAEASYLERSVFDGVLTPAAWFGKIDHAADDFTATANVLYGQSDSALVADHNPLVASRLGGELRAVYTSPPLAMPALAVRAGVLDSAQRQALDRALAGAASGSTGEIASALAGLQLDGFRPVGEGTAAGGPGGERKAMEIAGPGGFGLPLSPLPLPKPADLPFALGVELPDIPISASPGGDPRN